MDAKRFFYVLAATIVLAIASIVGAFVWGKGQLKTNATNVSNLLAERDAQREKIIKLQKAESQEDKIVELNELLDTLLPKEKKQETLVLDIIYTATAEAGIPFSSIKTFSFSGGGDVDKLSGTEALKELPGVLVYPFNLEISDISYTTLLNLLKEIETNGRIIQVANIQISPSKAIPGQLSSVSLAMEAYVKP